MKTGTELRELDAWIAKHVFGFKEGGRKKLSASEGRTFYYWIDDFGPCSEPFYPTIDDAAAMQVLRKCLECRSVVLNKEPTGKCCIVELKMGALGLLHTHDPVSADTLPLAICLFAKQLFSKEAK